MRVNADFTQRVLVRAGAIDWRPSPMAGVERKMLDRIGDEVARATSIVRFAPGGEFSEHTHDGGEEFLVLEGVFSDEHGDFPAGSYIRNPPTSHHKPHSDQGCTIFVKLHQFDPADRSHVRIDTRKIRGVQDATRPGVTVTPLFADPHEDVRLEEWKPGAEIELATPNGLEALVLRGGFEESGETLAPQDWLRLPPGATLKARANADGATLWVKTDHLSKMVA